METLSIAARLWVGHAVLALLVVAPLAWFMRHRLRWAWWESLAFLVPFAAWASLMFGHWIDRPKSLGNLGEAWLVSVAIIVGTAIRVFMGRRTDGVGARILILMGVTAAAVAVHLATPMWPE